MRSKIIGIVLCLFLSVLTGPDIAWAQCGSGWDNLAFSDSEYFGALPSGEHTQVGQQFATDCDGKFLSVSFLVDVQFLDLNGVRKLTAGDIVTCTVMDDLNQPIASVDKILTITFGVEQVDFDFGHLELGLATGQLGVKVDTPNNAYARVKTSDDQLPGDLLIFEGSGFVSSANRDVALAVSWDPTAIIVGVESETWSGVKALFR